ncbi:hypothetical protein IWQ56_001894 [Coemansia nantahalensis]|nr:hypothetical protein IWQ56_001894 [Coemansia nantahalensis]
MAEWRDLQLPLLSVCRQWRSLIGPHVLGQLFVSLEASQYADSTLAPEADGGVEDTQILTNIGIVVAGNRHAGVKVLDIRTEDPTDISALVERVALMLGARAMEWHGIETLRISFLFDELAIDTRSASADVEARAAQVCAELSQIAPNVTCLEVMGTSRSAECVLVTGGLVDMYAQQLAHLDVSFPITLASPEFSRRLGHLALELDGDTEQQLPQIYAPSLRYLSLGNVSGGAIWHRFHSSGQDVAFSSLKRLSISFASDSGRPGDAADDHYPPGTLQFPELETLSVAMCPAAGSLLSRATFPDTLRTLRVVGPLAGTVTLTNAVFGESARRAICKHIASRAADKADTLYTANFFLGPATAATAAHAAFHIGGTARMPADVAVQWPGLAELHIDTRVCAETLLAMLPGLPALSVLRAPDVVFADAAMRSLDLRASHKSCPGKIAAAATAMLAR